MSGEASPPTPSAERSFQLEWSHPETKWARCGVIVGPGGVTIWEKSGPGPQDEYGREFGWETWWTEGLLPPGAPAGLLARIDGAGKALGFSPPAPAAPRERRPKRRSRASRRGPAAWPSTWSEETRRVLGWSPGATPALRRLAEASGLHWVEPLGITSFHCWLGVRRLGGEPLARCPVVLCHGPNAATLATEARDSLAVLLWWLGPRESEQNWNRIRDAWPRIEEDVLAQAEGLGGEAAVDRFRDVLAAGFDRRLGLPANSPDFLRAAALVLGHLDPGQAELRERVVAVAAGEDRADWAPPPAWSNAWAATRFVAGRSDPAKAWAVAEAIPSLDTGLRLTVGHFVNVRQDWSGGDIRLATKVALREPRTGPVARAVAALGAAWERGGRYDGIAHLEAAASCALGEDFRTASTLLAGAGYWSQVYSGGTANPVLSEAWAEVRRSAGW